MIVRLLRLWCVALLWLLLALPVAARPVAAAPPVEDNIQAFLQAQPGALKSYQDGQRSAPELIEAASAYYGLSPRILLALLEATGRLLSEPAPAEQLLRQPFGNSGPDGFAMQLDWASRELRAGLGPYERPPTVRFSDGTTLTLTLQQAPEGVAVQRFLAKGRDQSGWRATFDRFTAAFQLYFNNELPEQAKPQPAATLGFLHRPWTAGTRVVHLAYFDHMFPTVDTERSDNGFVVNYLGRGNVQYDGHDGHDFYFPDQPIGTYILAAADGIAHASTHRGNGVWIEHSDGYVSVYWHLDKFASIFRGKVDTGAGVEVHAGDLIGSSGKTGFVVGSPHLHFEIRHNGKQVDPYGWYGPGADPCVAYVACEASVWLWSDELRGEFDFTPPDVAPIDTTPPIATLAVNPRADLLFLARFDGNALQEVGEGMPTVDGALSYADARFGAGAQVAGSDRLAYPTEGNLRSDAGTIAFWARLPERYPDTKNNRQYLLAASAHADEGPIYTGTLALRRELTGPNNTPQWNFWTTPESGEAGRNDLTAPDTLAPGLHYFALSWDRAQASKELYIDGVRVAEARGLELPRNLGAMLDLGRWSPGAPASGALFDDLAIFNRALPASEIAQLASSTTRLQSSAARMIDQHMTIETHALDNGGAITSVQLGVNGLFDDPQPLQSHYPLQLPAATGSYTVAARLFDRAGNSTIVSTTVQLVAPNQLRVGMEAASPASATLTIAQTAPESDPFTEVQISATPDFVGANWQPLEARITWDWPRSGTHVVWLRARDAAGIISGAQAFGPQARQLYLPLVGQ